VYDVENNLTTATSLLILADKPTPMPMSSTGPVVFVTPVDVAPPADAEAPTQPPTPVRAGDGTIPLDLPTLVPAPTTAPIPVITGPSGPGAPINPIPVDPNSPPPVRLDTPAQTDPSQLPFAPAPVYLTPIELNP
jgi:hypothetical protein